MDPWELLDPVDIIPMLPENFNDLLSSKKWSERKDVLGVLHGLLVQNPKLADNLRYRELIGQLIMVCSTVGKL